MTGDEEGTNWWAIAIVVVYITAMTLTAGNAWHTTCAEEDEKAKGPGRWCCSFLIGAVWPATILTHLGIWVMDPRTKMPTVRFE